MLFKNENNIYEHFKMKTNKSNRLSYQFNDKSNLKNPNKNMALANLVKYMEKH